MVSMFAELDELTALGAARHSGIESVQFETNDKVDDVALTTRGGRVFVQAKRTISVSKGGDSEFSSVIRQFVHQHITSPGDDAFVLATTSAASSRVTSDLRTLTEAARLNRNHATNPATKNAREVLATTSTLIDLHYAALAGREISDHERSAIFAKIHVQVLDLEDGAPLERAILIALAARGVPSANAAWAELVKLALTLAKDRLSIDRTGLLTRIGPVLTPSADANAEMAAESAMRTALDGDIGVAYEFVLLQDLDGLVVSVFFRFDDNGAKVLHFKSDSVTLPDGTAHTVIARTSSIDGLARILTADPALVEHDVVLDIGRPVLENEEAITQYRSELRQRLSDNSDLLSCLRCSRPVAEDRAPYIEIDEVDEASEVGLIHSACRRPTYRVLGALGGDTLAQNDWLGDFDYGLWLRQIVGGQGMFNDMSAVQRSKRAMVSWNPSRSHLSVGTWGVALVHADGNEHFTTNRGVVESFTKDQAERVAQFMQQELSAAAAAGDPSCVSAETGASGRYSQLLEYFAHEGTPIEIVRAEPRELSRAAINSGRRVENYYAPLLALIDVETNEPFELGDALLLLTDPLRLPDFVANWTAAGADVPTLATAIIRDDAQFDALVAGYALRSVRVVVNALLKRDGSLASGVILAPELLWLQGYSNPFDDDAT